MRHIFCNQAASGALAAALGFTMLCASAAQAQTSQDGEAIVRQGASGVAACIGCHGAVGEGNAAAGFPRLAGQPATYIERQLVAYATGLRDNPVMTPIAKGLNPQQRRSVVLYYAALPPQGGPSVAQGGAGAAPAGPASAAKGDMRGFELATRGDESKKVQACANCHGPQGSGSWAVYPYLAGQSEAYLNAVLGEWRSGQRNTDSSGQMPVIAKSLSGVDINAVSAYYASLPPPAQPVDAQRLEGSANAPARPGIAGRTVVSGPTRPANSSGVGTEQGGALGGGTQGVGGPGEPTGPRSGAPNR